MDASTFLDHACGGSSMAGTTRQQVKDQSRASDEQVFATAIDPPTTPSTRIDLPPSLPEQLPTTIAELGVFPHQWRKIREAAPPGYTLAHCLRDLGKLRTRHDYLHSKPAVLTRALERREPVYSQRELDERAAELAALDPSPAPQLPSTPQETRHAAPTRDPERVARGRPRHTSPAPALTREELAAAPSILDAMPELRELGFGTDRPGDSGGGPPDGDRPLRE